MEVSHTDREESFDEILDQSVSLCFLILYLVNKYGLHPQQNELLPEPTVTSFFVSEVYTRTRYVLQFTDSCSIAVAIRYLLRLTA